jgi:hypothetical protein
MDKSHRFNCDMTCILTDYIKPDMPEEIETVVEPFSFWEEHMEAGVCVYIYNVVLVAVLVILCFTTMMICILQGLVISLL